MKSKEVLEPLLSFNEKEIFIKINELCACINFLFSYLSEETNDLTRKHLETIREKLNELFK